MHLFNVTRTFELKIVRIRIVLSHERTCFPIRKTHTYLPKLQRKSWRKRQEYTNTGLQGRNS